MKYITKKKDGLPQSRQVEVSRSLSAKRCVTRKQKEREKRKKKKRVQFSSRSVRTLMICGWKSGHTHHRNLKAKVGSAQPWHS